MFGSGFFEIGVFCVARLSAIRRAFRRLCRLCLHMTAFFLRVKLIKKSRVLPLAIAAWRGVMATPLARQHQEKFTQNRRYRRNRRFLLLRQSRRSSSQKDRSACAFC